MLIFILILLFAPLVSFLLLLSNQKIFKESAGLFSVFFAALNLLGSVYLFSQVLDDSMGLYQWEWFRVAGKAFVIHLQYDALAALMCILLNVISTLVQLFSLAYMRGDKHYARYYAYLSLFTFAMTGLLLTDHLLIIYIFWELVGFCSYLLIGFWYEKKAAVRASFKAFITNRVGDLGFLTGILLLYVYFGTFQLLHIQEMLAEQLLKYPELPISLIGLCLFSGSVAKSAQFPLQIWLPDAMEGPTPVSALIHAATMVAAGVYLLARVFFLLNPFALQVIAMIGLLTAFIGAFSALAQSDIKKVLAYSTISQLGYMVMGMGLGAYQAALFHLFTHAFFKAGLFLCAGYVIHYMHSIQHQNHKEFDAQNIYLMGGLRKEIPLVYYCFLVCALSLAGIPLFSGFLSKDLLLSASLAQAGSLGYWFPFLSFTVAGMTAFYVGRLLCLVFFGNKRLALDYSYQEKEKFSFYLPLILLASCSFVFLFSLNPFETEGSWFFSMVESPGNMLLPEGYVQSLEEGMHEAHFFTILLSSFLSFAGIFLAYAMFRNVKLGEERPILASAMIQRISSQGLFINQIYEVIFVKPFYKRPSSPDQLLIERNEGQHSLFSGISKLSKQHFYLDHLFQERIPFVFLKFSRLVYAFEANFLDYIVRKTSVLYVVFSHIVSWIDRFFVDGLVNFSAYLAILIGKRTRTPASGKIQLYFIGTLCVLLFFFVYVFWAY